MPLLQSIASYEDLKKEQKNNQKTIVAEIRRQLQLLVLFYKQKRSALFNFSSGGVVFPFQVIEGQYKKACPWSLPPHPLTPFLSSSTPSMAAPPSAHARCSRRLQLVPLSAARAATRPMRSSSSATSSAAEARARPLLQTD